MARINQAMQDLLRYNAAILPQKRSSFNKSHSHTTTMDSAYLVPLMWDRVVPGDEKKIRYSGLARMATPIHPVMDEAKLDVWAFYVPDRLWWNHAKEFYGENLDASFNPDGVYEMPSLTPDQYLVNTETDTGSLNDYFGFPIWNNSRASLENVKDDMRCTAGLHRSYQLIWNEWFRNSSVQPALRLNKGDNVTDDEWSVIKQIRKVCKYPDYFTSLLREPQAGGDVSLPLGEWAPVVTREANVSSAVADNSEFSSRGLKWARKAGIGFDLIGNETPDYAYGLYVKNGGTYFNKQQGNSFEPNELIESVDGFVSPINLWTDLTNATAATINNLRAAITIQHLLEIDALGGKRYQNIIQAHFGVLTPDATLQRPELLGATRTSIGMRQVLQTSATEANSPQGNTAAFSLTNVTNEWICNKAFTEPGFIMVLGAIRPVQSYSQGVDPLLRKLNRYDHYWTVFDNLGNQPVDTTAIFFTSSEKAFGLVEEYSRDVFGYQEAWTEYRMKQNRVSGLMRPDHPTSLATWNYSTLFTEPPVLNSAFVEEDENLIDRTIAVTDEPQFIIDSYFDYIDVKNMSVHSIPGLLRL